MIVSYVLAVIPLVPVMFSIVELGSAMPRAGGTYYFLDRTLGPLVGTIGGFGTWLALTFKTAFSLIGMGAYVNLYLPQFEIVPAALRRTGSSILSFSSYFRKRRPWGW